MASAPREISRSLRCGAAFADDDLREVRERREIAGRADGTLRGNYWMNFGVEHRAKRFDGCGADAAESFGERVGAEKHHRAGFGFAERIADAAGVRAHEIDLELADLFGGDADGGEFAEAGVDAVGGGAGGDERSTTAREAFMRSMASGCKRDFGVV